MMRAASAQDIRTLMVYVVYKFHLYVHGLWQIDTCIEAYTIHYDKPVVSGYTSLFLVAHLDVLRFRAKLVCDQIHIFFFFIVSIVIPSRVSIVALFRI